MWPINTIISVFTMLVNPQQYATQMLFFKNNETVSFTFLSIRACFFSALRSETWNKACFTTMKLLLLYLYKVQNLVCIQKQKQINSKPYEHIFNRPKQDTERNNIYKCMCLAWNWTTVFHDSNRKSQLPLWN